MKVVRTIDKSTSSYDLVQLSHTDMMKIYEGLNSLYRLTHRLPIREVDDELAKKICAALDEAVKEY